MAEIHFDSALNNGITESSDGHVIHYQVLRLNGISDEGTNFQVDYEAAGDFNPKQKTITFESGSREISDEGHTFYLD